MEKKYMLTDETKIVNGKTLHRIKALKDFNIVAAGDLNIIVKAGDLGGFIEKEENLSQEKEAWVDENACVFGDARIYDNAQIFGNALVYENAQVCRNAQIFEKARISGNARISGHAQIYNNAHVYDNARIFGNACVFGYAQIFDDAQIYDSARVYRDAQVYGYALVYDNARVRSKAQIYGDARIYGYAQIYGNAQIFDDAQIYGNVQIFDNAVVSQNQYVSYGIVKTDLSKTENLANSIKAQCNLLAINNKVIAYKLVRPDLTSFYDRDFHYEVGKEIEVKDCEESDRACANGLHFSNLTYWEIESINEEYVYLEAEIDINDIITVQRGKIRCRKAKILRSFSI